MIILVITSLVCCQFIELDGCNLTVEELVNIGMGLYSVRLSEQAKENVKKARQVVDNILAEERGVQSYTCKAMLLYCLINVCSTCIIIITSPHTYLLNSLVTLLLFMLFLLSAYNTLFSIFTSFHCCVVGCYKV